MTAATVIQFQKREASLCHSMLSPQCLYLFSNHTAFEDIDTKQRVQQKGVFHLSRSNLQSNPSWHLLWFHCVRNLCILFYKVKATRVNSSLPLWLWGTKRKPFIHNNNDSNNDRFILLFGGWGGLFPGGGGLHPGGWADPPPELEKWAVRILLECFLVTNDFWWFVKVTLVVAFSYLPRNFGRRWGPTNDTFALIWLQLEQCGQSNVAGTLKTYLL